MAKQITRTELLESLEEADQALAEGRTRPMSEVITEMATEEILSALRLAGQGMEAVDKFLEEMAEDASLVTLVRDKDTETTRDKIFYELLPQDVLMPLLRAKLSETAEVNLFDPSEDSLAEVYEVFRSLAEKTTGGLEAVIEKANQKRREQGAYDEGYGMFRFKD